MIRILHTGDLHIGRSYNKYGSLYPEVAERYRQARLEALENVVKAANERSCDYLVIAGDTFDNKNVSAELIKTVCDILRKSVCPVIVIPGNHDFCEGENDAFWNKFNTLSGDNTILLREHAAYAPADGKAVFYPCGCKDATSEKNALGWLSDTPRSAESVNIGIAHGAIETLSYDKEGKYYGMTMFELDQTGMDLWLIGHTHIPFPNEEKISDQRVFNAGTHQQTDIADNSEGSVFVINIDDTNTVTAQKVHTGVIRFVEKDVTVSHGNSLRDVLENTLSDDGSNTSYRINLSGIASDEDYNNRGQIYNELRDKALFVEFLDEQLFPEITEERIDRETLPNSVENALLKQYLDEPEMLSMALDIVRECKGGQ